MKNDEIRGLYFPYANIESLKTLKTAALYFDRIGIIDPRASFCGEPGSARDLNYRSRTYLAEIDTLLKEGIIELIDPAKVVAEFGEEILIGIIQDMYNKDFLEVCMPFMDSSWVLSSAKLPGDTDKLLHDMLVNIPTLTRTPPQSGRYYRERLKKELLAYSPELIERHPQLLECLLHRIAGEDPYFEELVYRRFPSYFEERRFRGRRFERRHGRYDDEYDASLLRELMFEEYRVVELPFAVGESIMIGQALAAAASGNFTPFCDERIHFDALQARLRALSTSKALKAVLHEYGYLKDAKTDLAAVTVINEVVPSLELVPIEKILEFRRRRADELEGFRTEIRRLITDVESTPGDKEFFDHIVNLVNSKVRPALKEVKDQIQGCQDDFWVDAAKVIGSVGPLPIIGSIFASIPPHIAVGVGATFAGLTLILERWAKMTKIKRNGWVFLLDVGRLRGRGARA